MRDESQEKFVKNLKRFAALDAAVLVLSLFITSCGIYAVVKLEPTKASPGVTYVTLVIGIIAALTSSISCIAFCLEKFFVGCWSQNTPLFLDPPSDMVRSAKCLIQQ
ncbi:unnamed protein product [Hymenolepis diminuta]|uniref:Uncharacterized protein n=1 Tax=Hymenolepis diminuta TaxID=6216 RepID=A0A564YDK5_HYMDI|nr:unnamed protein product [Hymenolepis diminuta]